MVSKQSPKPLLVIVFGGRSHQPSKDERWKVAQWLQSKNPDLVIHGGARGADEWMSKIAAALGLQVRVFDANWKEFGKRGGPIRNTDMILFAREWIANREGCVTALMAPGNSGTADMMHKCERERITVVTLSSLFREHK